MKKALIVGINYPGTSNALRGCVNDANIMNTLLRNHYGFSNIRMLLDRQATAANMLKELNLLVAGAVPGDTIFFHYSGHGSQIRNTDGTEKDGLDEILCPIDLDWRTKIVRDNDLKRIFDKLPKGVNLTVCLDCCHSGGGLDQDNQYQPNVPTRDIQEAGGRFLPPPAFAVEGADEMREGFQPKMIQSRDVNQTGLLLTGCRSHQTSADAYINGKFQGAFTYALNKVLADNNYNIDHVKLINEINNFMVAAGYSQRPELNGSPSLFDSKFLIERDYATRADLHEMMKIQPNVDGPEIENKYSCNTLILIGIVVSAAVILFL